MQASNWRRSRGSVAAPEYALRGGPMCPLCQGELLRERRRTVDRLRSLFRPVKRYRCERFDCQWVGNIATSRTEKPAYGVADGADDRVPFTFVVHMVLVASAVVFVLVFSQMEPRYLVDESDQAHESVYVVPMPERPADGKDAR